MKIITSISLLLLLAIFTTPDVQAKDKKQKEPSSILTFDEAGNYEYSHVYEFPGKSKEEIYSAVKNWIVENIKSSSNTNYFDETEKSKLSTTPFFSVAYNCHSAFKLVIDVKDGKYRLSATSFIFITLDGAQKTLGDYEGLYGAGKKLRVAVLADVDEYVKTMLSSIEESVKSGGNDNW